jgi:hypothetical protein
MIEGGCFCKRIRYAINPGKFLSANCHCNLCRRAQAAPFVTWLVVPKAEFQYTAAAPTQLASSADGTRYFCNHCGTHVACVNTAHPDIVDVTVGSLDDPALYPPTMNIFEDSELPWAFQRQPG